MVLRDGTFRRWLSHKGSANAFEKESSERERGREFNPPCAFRPFSCVRTWGMHPLGDAVSRSHLGRRDHVLIRRLDLEPPISRIVRNKSLHFVNYTVSGIAQTDKETCPTVLPKTFGTVSNRRCERIPPSLILNFTGKHLLSHHWVCC